MDDARRCTATSKQSGNPCRAWAIRGSTVCWKHGGATPQVQAAARRRLAEQRAAANLAEVGVYPVDDPVEALADLAAEATAVKNHFADRVAELEELRYTSTWNTEQMRTEVALYERSMDRLGRLLGQWISLGLDERRVRLGEAQGRQLDTFLRAVLEDLGLLDDPRVPVIVRRHADALRQTGAPAPPLARAEPPAPTIPALSAPTPEPPVDDDLDYDDLSWARFDDEVEDEDES